MANPTGTTYIRKKGSATEVASCSKCGAWKGQLGLETDYRMYLSHLLMVTAELKRVLKKGGTLWWNMGDSHAGSGNGHSDTTLTSNPRRKKVAESVLMISKRENAGIPAKSLMLMPERFAMRMIDEQGWILRDVNIWHKKNHLPESVIDRLSHSYEFVFFFVKNPKYFFNLDAIRVPFSPDTHPYGKNGSFEANMDAPTAPTWGIDGSQSLRGKKHRCYRSGNKERKVEQFRLSQLGSSIPWSAEDSPGGKNPGDFWEINTRPHPFAHFSVYPTELCIVPIKAGCPSEICTKCGKAREKIIQSSSNWEFRKQKGATGGAMVEGAKQQIGSGWSHDLYSSAKVVGHTDCGCNAPFRPGIVLDPFGGSGTTGVAARQLGRNSILIEVSKDYCDIIKRRMEWGQQSLDGTEWIEE